MFGPVHPRDAVSETPYSNDETHTSQQSDPPNIPTKLDIVRDKVTLQRRARTQRRVPQLLKVDERLVALDELRPTRGLAERRRRLCEAEEAVELGEGADGAEPHAAVLVELRKHAGLERLDRGVAVLAGFFEGADSAREGGHNPAICSLVAG